MSLLFSLSELPGIFIYDSFELGGGAASEFPTCDRFVSDTAVGRSVTTE